MKKERVEMKRNPYPFTAIVDQEQMKTALLLNAVDPSIGGVLISGHKGTGKSTAVRGLAALLPEIKVVKGCPYHCDPAAPSELHKECYEPFTRGTALPQATITMPLVELPLSATEDRVVGTLHIKDALQSGELHYEPGLLAAAHRGILYVDEVNLLEDHLVDILLDAAASGINIVEREGVSYAHPARFILVGTMNPEEGILRPQFLDRFGLFVSVRSVKDDKQREEIVRRRIAWETDTKSFRQQWREPEHIISRTIQRAQQSLKRIEVPDTIYSLAIRLATSSDAHGHRAEIAIIKTARALAALLDEHKVKRHHVAEAAYYVLPHRVRNIPIHTPDNALENLSGIIKGVLKGGTKKNSDDERENPEHADDEDMGYPDEPMGVPGAGAAGSIIFNFEKKTEKIIEPDNLISAEDIKIADEKAATTTEGRHKRPHSSKKRTGRYVRSAPLSDNDTSPDIAVDATFRAAALRKAHQEHSGSGALSVKPEDLRRKIHTQFLKTLIVFLVDASDSMGTEDRMAAAKGAVLALLKHAYQDRDMVALVSFRDESARVLLQPTTSVALARKRLRNIPAGGSTPFAAGMECAHEIIKLQRIKDPEVRPILVILSDGEANVPLTPGTPVLPELLDIAQTIREDSIISVIIDAHESVSPDSPMTQIAEVLDAQYHHIQKIRAGTIVEAVRHAEHQHE